MVSSADGPRMFLGYWGVTGSDNYERLVNVIEVLPFGALLKVRHSGGWLWRVETSETLARWQWRYIPPEEAETWPQWKLQ